MGYWLRFPACGLFHSHPSLHSVRSLHSSMVLLHYSLLPLHYSSLLPLHHSMTSHHSKTAPSSAPSPPPSSPPTVAAEDDEGRRLETRSSGGRHAPPAPTEPNNSPTPTEKEAERASGWREAGDACAGTPTRLPCADCPPGRPASVATITDPKQTHHHHFQLLLNAVNVLGSYVPEREGDLPVTLAGLE